MYYQPMTSHYGVDTGVIRKVASTPSAAARLRHELRVLEHLDDTHTVTLLAADSSGDHPWLETRRIDGETAAVALSCSRLDARALHHIAQALTRLHGQGFAHGSFSADHIILGRTGRATFCSLGRATHPASHDEQRADTTALGLVISEAGERTNNERLILIGRQLAVGTRDLWETALSLEHLASQRAVPTSHDRPPHRRHRRALAGAVGAVAAVLVPIMLLGRAGGSPTSDHRCVATAGPTVTLADNPCPVPLSVDGDGQVHVGNRTYALNLARSQVRITDRDCDGSAELEVVDGSGSAAVFDEWPAANQPIAATLRALPTSQEAVCETTND